MDQFSDRMWSLPKQWSFALLIDVAMKVSLVEHRIRKRTNRSTGDRRTVAVTAAAEFDFDVTNDATGGFRRVGSSLLSLGGGLCLAVATSFLFVVSQYYYHTQLY